MVSAMAAEERKNEMADRIAPSVCCFTSVTCISLGFSFCVEHVVYTSCIDDM